MKRIFVTLFLSLTLALCTAQVFQQERPISQGMSETVALKSVQNIGNFTITDSNGVEWNLHELLDSGKTVIIDLFFST